MTALDDGGPQSAFASIVRRLDFAGKRTEDEQLVSRAGDFGDQFAGDGAGCRRRQNLVDLALQFASFCAKRRLRHAGKIGGQNENAVEPELEPEGNWVFACLQTISDVAREMSEACLMERCMSLLCGVTVGCPHVWPMPIHGFAHDFRRTGEVSHMNDGALAQKHPMEGVDAFDAHARLIAGDKGSLAQNRESLFLLLLKSARRASEHIHQRALADRQAKQIVENLL